MSPDPSVSVVVPTHQRRSTLPAVLAPLLDDPATSELVVVVDLPRGGAGDGTWDDVTALAGRDPRVRALRTQGAGATGANEAGLRAATGDVVLFVDDDVIAEPGLVSGHARRHAERPGGLVVVGYMPTTRPERAAPGSFATTLYADEYEGRTRAWADGGPDAVLSNLWMGNVSLRREDALRVGLSGDGSFTALRHSDREFGLRCLRAGLVGVFDRELGSRHAHHRTLAQFRSDSRRQGAGRALLARHHGDLVEHLDVYDGLARPLRAVSLGAAAARLDGPLRALVALVTRTSGRLGAHRLELLAAKWLRRLEQQAGAREALS